MKTLKNNLPMILIVVGLIYWLFGFALEVTAQTNGEQSFIVQVDMPDTTKIHFRSDTLTIINNWVSTLTVEGHLLLMNLDYFGLSYYNIIKKHNIKFEDYIQKQIDAIFEKEKRLGSNSK